jgi:hypothetical protein
MLSTGGFYGLSRWMGSDAATQIPSFVKICLGIQKFIGVVGGHVDRKHGDTINLLFCSKAVHETMGKCNIKNCVEKNKRNANKTFTRNSDSRKN